MAKPAILDALETLKASIGAAITNANIPNKGQVFVGQPVGPEITKILSQNDAEYYIAIFPVPRSSTNTTRYPKNFQQIAAAPNGLIATVSPINVVTFTGTLTPTLAEDVSGGEDAVGGEDVAISGVYNVYVFLAGYPGVAGYVQTTSGMTLAGLAAAMAVSINGLGLSGVNAAAVGAAMTVTGANVKYANVGSSGSIAREIARVHRFLEVSIFCSDPIVRLTVGDAIYLAIGDAISLFQTMSNGSQMFCRYSSDALDESSQNEYTLYVQHFVFEVEYGIVQVAPAWQIEAVTETIANFPPATAILGGTT